MAINTATIQHRRGSLDDFNPEKLTPGELAVITDERSVYMGFPGGEAEKIVLEKDFTSESIKEKLGYEPADEERVDQLFRDKADYQYVDKKVSNVKVDIVNQTTIISPTIEQGGIQNSAGNFNSYTRVRTKDRYKIERGEYKLNLESVFNHVTHYSVYLYANDTVIESTSIVNWNPISEPVFTVPSNGYIRVAFKSEGDDIIPNCIISLSICSTYISNSVNVINSDIAECVGYYSNIKDKIKSVEDPSKSNVWDNVIIPKFEYGSIESGGGKPVESYTRIRTIEYIEVGRCKSIYIDIVEPNNYKIFCYDRDKNYIERFSSLDWTAEKEFELNSLIRYVKIVIRRNDNGDDINPISAYRYKIILKMISVDRNFDTYYVASADASDYEKNKSDYVCDGLNDEVEIQKAIDMAVTYGGRVKLSSGKFIIDSLPKINKKNMGGYTTDVPVAIMIPQYNENKNNSGYIVIEGAGIPPYYDSNGGTIIKMSHTLYESLDSTNPYGLISAEYTSGLTELSKSNVEIRNLAIQIPYNQKKITMIDCYSMNRVSLEKITLFAFEKGYGQSEVSVSNPPPKAIDGCVGVKMQSGSNQSSITDYKNVRVEGFYEGFKVGAEHVIMWNCVAQYCVYGYTFHKYLFDGGMDHPITLINCCDERNVNLPLFDVVGTSTTSGANRSSVTMIDFNIERIAFATPGKVLGNLAKEVEPGRWHGKIMYTGMTSFGNGNTKDFKFWDDGSGIEFETVNVMHSKGGNTSERNSYSPNLFQTYYDTTLNKMLIYNGQNWTDCNGNVIS